MTKANQALLFISYAFIPACNSSIDAKLVTKVNDALHTHEQSHYKNLYASPFKDLGPYHAIDNVDFIHEREKKVVEETLFSFSYSGIDKAYGFEYSEWFQPADIDPLDRNIITWLGHASFLIQDANGNNFLTDPVLGEFDGFVGKIGTLLFKELRRLGPPPVQAEGLNMVDAVLVSHDHYDHFSNETISALPNKTDVFLPIGMEKELSAPSNNVFALDWYTQVKYNKTTVSFVPAHHYSNRGLFDQNKSLWGGWLLNVQDKKIYFAGDTGYSPIFKDIHNKYGDIDVCLMPIVAYGKHYRTVHMSPEDAIKAASVLHCKVFVPWGFGTWQLGFEHLNEPLRRLNYALRLFSPEFTVRILSIGESFNFSDLI
jgi:L-ascorbate metabolism protein UlaG (beta-lactamase superfamily)